MTSPLRNAALATLAAATTLAAQDAPKPTADFVRDVLPILESRCFECHRAPYEDERGRRRNPKGGLRLDTRELLLLGGDGGPVVVAGRPGDSALYTRTVLPADDPDIMPEKGDPLTPAQADVLKRWIAAGAPFGDWTGATTEPAPPVPATSGRATLYARLAADLAPPAAATLRTALGAHGRAEPLVDAGSLLRVSYPAHQESVDTAALRALGPLAAHVAELDLRRTPLTDLAGLPRLPRLVRLDLGSTRVDDAALRALRELPELRSLSLCGTPVTDRGLATLAELPALEHLYLWQSAATAAGVATLRARRPALHIVLAPELPADAPPQRQPERPRRR
ncbi:MAG: hypothetical protein IPM29_13655 [Planctomycetes bacterium]|nr:hypothetical protein [Planctomycetota bacterium]